MYLKIVILCFLKKENILRSGRFIKQQTGYNAFIPSKLPPNPPIKIEDEIHNLLTDANMAIGKLDAMGFLVPNLNHIIAMYIKKEALLSSQIEGTQASLENIFEYEGKIPIKNINDVKEVINYIKALDYGIKRLKDFPMSVRLIKEIHKILLQNTRGKEKSPGEFKKSQNWIGAPGSTLLNTTFVPPPPYETVGAMSNLELFLHKETKLKGKKNLLAVSAVHDNPSIYQINYWYRKWLIWRKMQIALIDIRYLTKARNRQA